MFSQSGPRVAKGGAALDREVRAGVVEYHVASNNRMGRKERSEQSSSSSLSPHEGSNSFQKQYGRLLTTNLDHGLPSPHPQRL